MSNYTPSCTKKGNSTSTPNLLNKIVYQSTTQYGAIPNKSSFDVDDNLNILKQELVDYETKREEQTRNIEFVSKESPMQIEHLNQHRKNRKAYDEKIMRLKAKISSLKVVEIRNFSKIRDINNSISFKNQVKIRNEEHCKFKKSLIKKRQNEINDLHNKNGIMKNKQNFDKLVVMNKIKMEKAYNFQKGKFEKKKDDKKKAKINEQQEKLNKQKWLDINQKAGIGKIKTQSFYNDKQNILERRLKNEVKIEKTKISHDKKLMANLTLEEDKALESFIDTKLLTNTDRCRHNTVITHPYLSGSYSGKDESKSPLKPKTRFLNKMAIENLLKTKSFDGHFLKNAMPSLVLKKK